MSNNKKSMKLYTEEQVRDAIKYGQNYGKMDRGEIPYVTDDEFINLLTPIELPSDEEIGQEFKHGSENWEVRQALEFGAKWMRDKIGDNK